MDSDFPGGTIKTAYYTCTAGLGGSCNHIKACLFRVESFAITDKTWIELIEKKPLNCTNARRFNLPKPVSEVQQEFVYNHELSVSANVTEFTNLLMPTDDQTRDLAKFTQSQAKCQEWCINRQGKITMRQFFMPSVLEWTFYEKNLMKLLIPYLKQ